MLAKKDFVVYTALFGDYDCFQEPAENFEGCDFVYFTDNEDLKSDVWKIHVIKTPDLTPGMMNRRYKILPHSYVREYNQSLYVDANIRIMGNPRDLAARYLKEHDIAAPKHFSRNCVYEEAKACIILGRSDLHGALAQMKYYKAQDYPKHNGLMENGILLRNHNNPLVITTMEDWWNELHTWTQRDQLSLMFVAWRNGLSMGTMEEGARNRNRYFQYGYHRQYRNYKIHLKVRDKLNIWFRKVFHAPCYALLLFFSRN